MLLVVGLLIEIIKNVVLYLSLFCVLIWLPATLGFFGFFNVFKKRYLKAVFFFLGYFIAASVSLQVTLGLLFPYEIQKNHREFFSGEIMGLYLCALFATINCVVFAFALKKKLFQR